MCRRLLLYVLFTDLLVFNLFVVGLVTLKGAVMVPYTALSSPRRSSSSALVPPLSGEKLVCTWLDVSLVTECVRGSGLRVRAPLVAEDVALLVVSELEDSVERTAGDPLHYPRGSLRW